MGTADSPAGWQGQIRAAGPGDAGDVAGLAAGLAQSFAFSAERFRVTYPALLAADGTRLLLAVTGQEEVRPEYVRNGPRRCLTDC